MNGYEMLRLLHTIVGSAALLTAVAALIAPKGGSAHRVSGRVFFYSMTIVAASSIILAVIRWKPGILMLGVLSYYGVVSGYRSLYLKHLHEGRGVTWIDWAALLIALVNALTFLAYGIGLVVSGPIPAVGVLASVFATLGLIFIAGNVRRFLRPPAHSTHWVFNHFGGMFLGLIGGLTAFSVQVMTFLPVPVRWLWPTLLGVILSSGWTAYYRRRLAGGARLDELVQVTPQAHTVPEIAH